MLSRDSLLIFRNTIQPIFDKQPDIKNVSINQTYYKFGDYRLEELVYEGDYDNRILDTVPEARYIEREYGSIISLPVIDDPDLLQMAFSLDVYLNYDVKLFGAEYTHRDETSPVIFMEGSLRNTDPLKYGLSLKMINQEYLSKHGQMKILTVLNQRDDPNNLIKIFDDVLTPIRNFSSNSREVLHDELANLLVDNKEIDIEILDSRLVITGNDLDDVISLIQ